MVRQYLRNPNWKVMKMVVKNNASDNSTPICGTYCMLFSKCFTYFVCLFNPYNTTCKVLLKKDNEASLRKQLVHGLSTIPTLSLKC